MADKSFEQQVQENLSALRMKPDDAVWVEIEHALRKEKKRRWLIWFLLLSGCAGASYITYHHFTHNKGENELTKIAVQIKPLPKGQPKENVKEKNTVIDIPKKSIEKSIQPVTQTEMAVINKNKRDEKQYHIIAQKHDISPKEMIKENFAGKNEKSNSKTLADQDVTSKEIISNDKNSNKENTVLIPGTTQNNNDTALAKNEEKIKEPEVLTKETPKNDTSFTINKKNKKSKWQWSINAEAGSSGLGKSVEFGNAVSYAAAAPGSGSVGQSLSSTQVLKSAFSFGIQLQATRPLGKKHSIGILAGYSLFQTKTNLGKRVDSSAFFNSAGGLTNASNQGYYSRYYYNYSDTNNYTNQYHFLQVGAELYTPFRLFKKLSFRLPVGAGFNFLVATNGLQYDVVSNRLFINNALFAKIQFYLSTGIDVAIGKQPFLYIGPHWLYTINRLSKQSGNDQHLFQSAVKLSFVLPQKKINKMQR